MSTSIHVLYIEDDPGEAYLVKEELGEAIFGTFVHLDWVDRLEEGLQRISLNNIKAILLDLYLPDSKGLDTLKRVLACSPSLPVIVMADEANEAMAIRAVQAGAQDYLIKGQLDGRLLTRSIQYAIRRKNSEEALRQSEERFQRVVEATANAMIIVDKECRISVVNTNAQEMFGYTEKELVGQPIEILVPAGLRERHIQDRKNFFSQPTPRAFGVRHNLKGVRKDLSEIPLEIGLAPYESSKGLCVLALINDITEHKQSEEASRASEERLRRYFELGLIGMAITSSGKGFIEVNDRICKILGYERAELMEIPWDTITHPDDIAADVAQFNRLLTGEINGYILEKRFIHKSGAIVYTSISVNSVRRADGSVDYLVALMEDITERKQAEQAALESQRQMRALVTSLDDIVFELDNQGTYLNIWVADESLLAQPKTQLLGRRIEEILGKENARPFVEAVNRVLATGHSEIIEYPLEVIGGQRWFMARISPIFTQEDAGRTVSMLIRDITERKQAEEAVKQNEKRFRAVIENGRDNISLVDKNGVLIWESPAAIRTLGYSHNEFIGRNIFELLHPDDMDRVTNEFEQLLQEPEGNRSDVFRLRHQVGEWRWVEAMASNLLDEPSVGAIVINYRDITERKQAEAALAQRLTELEAINRISTVLRAAESLDEMLPQVLDETLAVIGTDAGTIKLFQPSSNSLVSVVSRGWYKDIEDVVVRPGEGTSGTVFSTGEPYLAYEFVSDAVTMDSARPRIPSGWGGACIPIRSGQIITGVIFIAVRLPRELSRADINLLNTLAEMAGSAIHRMQLHEETVQQLERLNALQEIDRAISSSFDLRLTLEVVINQVIRLLKADAADILLIPPEAFRLEFAAGKGFRTSGIMSTRLGLGEGLPGTVARELRPLQIENLNEIKDKFIRRNLLVGENFVSYVGIPLIVKGKIQGVLEIFHRSPLKPDSSWIKFLETLAGQAAIAIDNSLLFQDVQRSNNELVVAYDATIEGWVSALDLRYKESKGHSERVTHLTLQLARQMGVREEKLIHIRRGALLHDIGKMVVPDHVLMNTGELSPDHQKLIRLHPQYAYDILSPIHYLKDALEIPYCHHERWNGTGYPRGLKGEQIPLAARIFAVVDVWDSLTSDRPYRPAWSKPKARKYIIEHSGTYFDPKVVEMFLKIMPENNTEFMANLYE